MHSAISSRAPLCNVARPARQWRTSSGAVCHGVARRAKTGPRAAWRCVHRITINAGFTDKPHNAQRHAWGGAHGRDVGHQLRGDVRRGYK